MKPSTYTTGQVSLQSGLTRQQMREAVAAGALQPAPDTVAQGHGRAALYSRGELWLARVVAEFRRYGFGWDAIAAATRLLRPALAAGDGFRNTEEARRAYWVEYLRFAYDSERKTNPDGAEEYIAQRCAELKVNPDAAKIHPTISLEEFRALGSWLDLQDTFSGRAQQSLICLAEGNDGAWQVSFSGEPLTKYGRFRSWIVLDLAQVLEGVR